MNNDELALFLSLHYMDDITLARACQVNKHFYRKICNNVWLQRILDIYSIPPEYIPILKHYRGDRSWYEYYIYDLKKCVLSSPHGDHVIIEQRVNCIEMDSYFNYLSDSAEGNRLDYVIIGVINGATANAIGDALIAASSEGYMEIVKYLVEQGANINYSYDNYTAIRVHVKTVMTT